MLIYNKDFGFLNPKESAALVLCFPVLWYIFFVSFELDV